MSRDPDSARQGYSARSYMDTLSDGLIPFYEPGMVFQQDNAPIHTACATVRWFEEHGIELMKSWPPYSPDLNPIEHL